MAKSRLLTPKSGLSEFQTTRLIECCRSRIKLTDEVIAEMTAIETERNRKSTLKAAGRRKR
jgi:hypothetical protein